MEHEAVAGLQNQAYEVLKNNDRGGWTVPSGDLYPHQWLWDSCFVAIGLRHIDADRAQAELRSLLRGQWANGMFPNMIFSADKRYKRDRELWRSRINPYSPDAVATSGITQPPMLAEAVLKVGQKLKAAERRSWYKQMLPALVRYHEWIYTERDPHHEGLALLIHPYESGLDNSPPWISELRKHSMPLWLAALEKARLGGSITLFRRDTQRTTLTQRMDNIEAAAYWAAMHRLRRKAYNSEAIISRSLFLVEDLAFNCIFIRANKCLRDIARAAGHQLPQALLDKMKVSETSLEQLFDEQSDYYFSRSFVSHKLIEEPSIASLLPLYAGSISKNRAQELAALLKKEDLFAPDWPVPTVPLDSPYFNPYKYWQGPAWINTNWLIIEGLKNYGLLLEAKTLGDKTLKLVSKSGFYEYFSPLDGSPAGAPDFSWTAALTIDLLKD